MNLRFLPSIAVLLALSACSTAGDPISKAWVGKSAGRFFANYGPPMADAGPNSYRWKGAYSRENGQLKSCSGVVSVNSKYQITSIRINEGYSGKDGRSYCQEMLVPDGDKAKK